MREEQGATVSHGYCWRRAIIVQALLSWCTDKLFEVACLSCWPQRGCPTCREMKK